MEIFIMAAFFCAPPKLRSVHLHETSFFFSFCLDICLTIFAWFIPPSSSRTMLKTYLTFFSNTQNAGKSSWQIWGYREYHPFSDGPQRRLPRKHFDWRSTLFPYNFKVFRETQWNSQKVSPNLENCTEINFIRHKDLPAAYCCPKF